MHRMTNVQLQQVLEHTQTSWDFDTMQARDVCWWK